MLLHGAAQRSAHLARAVAQHAARHVLTPCVIYVQQLAREMRRHAAASAAANGGEGGAMPTTRLLQLYLAAEAREGAITPETHTMLLQLYEMRALILLIDGVDEAADLNPKPPLTLTLNANPNPQPQPKPKPQTQAPTPTPSLSLALTFTLTLAQAADLKEVIEDYVTSELVREGHPLVVTSRPEGVRLRLYARDFVVMNLLPLTQEQQGDV